MDLEATQSTEVLGKELLEFRSGFRSVLLSTISHDSVPEASYAPCVTDDTGYVYIYVSGLSRHTRNLRDTGRVSLLFIEDEKSARNIFARKRLSYTCEAEAVARDGDDWDQVLQRFTDRFGKFVNTLRGLPDFQLFRLIPRSGNYVRGFAQAYSFQGAGLGEIHHINPAKDEQQPSDVATAEEILEFWFSEQVRPMWFKATKEFDSKLRTLFMSTWQFAAANRLATWESFPQGALALVIVLDQFPLNMFRGRPESYSTEADARRVAESAIAQGFDQKLNNTQKAFLYMPFMHSEDLADQQRSVKFFEAAGIENNLKWARHHHDIIRRFGRFPHRNAILGRESTIAESEYLNSAETFSG
jgi:uncharacterized protein (DUF924 family)/putative heme iron utilization protein